MADPSWTWNNYPQTTSPLWGLPWKCTEEPISINNGNNGCEQLTKDESSKLSWKDYHFLDASTCKSGLTWDTISRHGSSVGELNLYNKTTCIAISGQCNAVCQGNSYCPDDSQCRHLETKDDCNKTGWGNDDQWVKMELSETGYKNCMTKSKGPLGDQFCECSINTSSYCENVCIWGTPKPPPPTPRPPTPKPGPPPVCRQAQG